MDQLDNYLFDELQKNRNDLLKILKNNFNILNKNNKHNVIQKLHDIYNKIQYINDDMENLIIEINDNHIDNSENEIIRKKQHKIYKDVMKQFMPYIMYYIVNKYNE